MREHTMKHGRTLVADLTRSAVFVWLAAVCGLAAPPALAQQSGSYRLESAVTNEGGRPLQGVVLSGSAFRISLDAIGDAVAASGFSSISFRVDGGLVAAYPPPGEVQNQKWTNASTMTWDPEKSIGVYEVYRGLISGLPGGFGACFQSALPGTTAADGTTPPIGDGWFYLVTAKNGLGEEGTKGYQTGGAERSNSLPCP
jgi:hypothetical protein